MSQLYKESPLGFIYSQNNIIAGFLYLLYWSMQHKANEKKFKHSKKA